MTSLIAIIFWTVVGLAALGIWMEHLVTYLRSDGRGSVPPPRSHDHELDEQSRRLLR